MSYSGIKRFIVLFLILFPVFTVFADKIGELRSTTYSKAWLHPDSDSISRSPDYIITVEDRAGEQESFPYYGYMKEEYIRLVRRPNGESRDEKKNMKWAMSHTECMTWTSFSFHRGPVTVRIKVKKEAQGITLPLKSCKVLPSSYEIKSWIENGDTIVFQLQKPAKVFVIPNYEQAMAFYKQKGDNGFTEKKHTRVKNFIFDTITVNCPVIFFKSLIQSDYNNSLEQVIFRDLVINGQTVTEKNKGQYFEMPLKNAEKIYFR